MKTKILAFCLAICLAITATMAVGYAADTVTMDELIESTPAPVEEEQQPEPEATSVNPAVSIPEIKSETSSFAESLKEASKMDIDVEGVSKISSGIKGIVAFAVQVISIGIMTFLGLGVVLDICYIKVPISRKLLGNGYLGNGQADTGMNPQQSMMNSGFGTGYGNQMYGGGRFSRGYGNYGNYGAYGTDQTSALGTQAAANNQHNRSVQWVSNAALNAAAAESMPGPDGKPVNALTIYAKEMTVTLIVVPVILVLAASGTLQYVGILLANLIVGTLQGIGG